MTTISNAFLISNLLLIGLLASCGRTPDFERLRDTMKPESFAFGWFVDHALDLAKGDLSERFSIYPCFIFESPSFDLSDQDAEEAFRSACEQMEAVAEKHGIGGYSEWEEFSDLQREDFANEVGAVVDKLRNELVCGRGYEYLFEGDDRFRCRKQGSGPLLSPTFATALTAVKLFLADSAVKSATSCIRRAEDIEQRTENPEIENLLEQLAQIGRQAEAAPPVDLCKSEDDARSLENSQLVIHALSTGQFQRFTPKYAARGEWQVSLAWSFPESNHAFVERFKVVNEPARYTIDGKTIEGQYSRVIHCGGLLELGDRVLLTSGTLRTWPIGVYDNCRAFGY